MIQFWNGTANHKILVRLCVPFIFLAKENMLYVFSFTTKIKV